MKNCMKEFLRTGNSLDKAPTNFNQAHLSEEQIRNMINKTRATFKGYIHLEAEKSNSSSNSLLNKIARFLKLD